MLEAVSEVVPMNMLAVHFHDTYGQALSNILTSLQVSIVIFEHGKYRICWFGMVMVMSGLYCWESDRDRDSGFISVWSGRLPICKRSYRECSDGGCSVHAEWTRSEDQRGSWQVNVGWGFHLQPFRTFLCF